MKRIAIILILASMCLLMVCPTQADTQIEEIGSYIYRQLNGHLKKETIYETAINRLDFQMGGNVMSIWVPAEEGIIENILESSQMKNMPLAGISGSYVVYDVDESKKGLLTDTYWNEFGRFPREWNAFDAGERAGWGLQSLHYANSAFGNVHRKPVDPQLYEELSARCNNSVTVSGLDSAYIYGRKVGNDGTELLWEAWPFVILDYDDTVYENMIYIYYRCIFVPENDSEEKVEYYITDPEVVSMLFEHMIRLNPAINAKDRKEMERYIQYTQAENVTPKPTQKPMQTPKPTPTPKPTSALKTLSKRPTGLEIKRVSIGSTDENGNWAGRMGDSVSYSSLRSGHSMAYYIELYNAGMDYIDINLSLYVDGEYRGYWEPSRIPYKYTWTYWMWFGEEEIGTHTLQWCLDDQVLYEKKLTITP